MVGSATLVPILEGWARELAAETPPLAIRVESGGSSSAPHALLTGKADVASMSRRMTDVEASAFRQHLGGEPLAVAVATDAIAVFVHESNPVRGVTIPELDRVFARSPGCSDEPAIRTWGGLGLGGARADRAISRFGRSAGSGTRAVFERIALCGAHSDPRVRQRPGPRSIALSVAESPYSIAYGSASDAVPGVRTLSVSVGTGEPYVELGEQSVREGGYPLTRRLWLYTRPAERDPRWSQLVRLALSEPGQAIVESAGFWRVSERRRREGLAAVAE